MGWLDKLTGALKKTSDYLNRDIRDVFVTRGEILTEQHLAKIERALIGTDMGVEAASAVIDDLREKHLGRTVVVNEVQNSIKERIYVLLTEAGQADWNADDPLSPLNIQDAGTTVILVAGVNGVGKTTSIAKLANLLKSRGKSVLLAAGDTFRAAAVEQLTMWSQRLGCEIVRKESGADPASVAFAGCERALELGSDVLIVDTAGRLQTHKNLMAELGKIYRVIGKKIPGAPHESLLVLDATTGQNGLSQAQNFTQEVHCTGLVLAKLDGTAKGGVTIAIRQKMGIPVKYIGVGEKLDDLELFDARRFVESLFPANAK